MNALGIIFSDVYGAPPPDLIAQRTMASVPFGGRYLIVDFVLSSMVNSNTIKVGVITKTNYRSLMEHLGSGRDWDLARKNGGITILPPFCSPEGKTLQNNRLEALKGIADFVTSAKEEYVILSGCNLIYNINFKKVLDFHKESGADITGVYKRLPLTGSENRSSILFTMDADSRVTDLAVYSGAYGEKNVALNVWIMKRTFLQSIVDEAISRGKSSLTREVLAPNLDKIKLYAYEYNGYLSFVDSVKTYLRANLALLKKDVRDSLFCVKDSPILTRIRDLPPTKYGKNACVRNALVAEACRIDGTVENSVIFKGVKIGAGSIVKNCVLMPDTQVGRGVLLESVVSDGDVTIRDGRVLSGFETHPFYINRGSMI